MIGISYRVPAMVCGVVDKEEHLERELMATTDKYLRGCIQVKEVIDSQKCRRTPARGRRIIV